MQIIADTHTHSVACGHAYSTILENIQVAARKGLRILGCAEHGVAMYDAPKLSYFQNLKRTIPDYYQGVYLLKGCEANVVDYDGSLDLPREVLSELDWVIASMHSNVLKPGTVEEHTRAWIGVAQNPLVNVIGHPGDGRFAFDYEKVIPIFGECGKIVEINAHSNLVRPCSEQNCTRILQLCKQHRVPVIVNSDAHFCEDIGYFDFALQLLERTGFPEELVVNADFLRFARIINERTTVKIPLEE